MRAQPKAATLRISDLDGRHLPEVFAIEATHFKPRECRTRDQWRALCGTHWGYVAELKSGRRSVVVGYVTAKDSGHTLTIDRLVVHPSARRKGIGTAIVNHLTRCPELQDKHWIEAWVDEYDLDAQLFLKACSLRYVETRRTTYRFVKFLNRRDV